MIFLSNVHSLSSLVINLHCSILPSLLLHRYMLGVYELQQRIVTAFPNILLENCASGGGRFDPGECCCICKTISFRSEYLHLSLMRIFEVVGNSPFNVMFLSLQCTLHTLLAAGMLYYSPQIWCSDNTDALIRMKIQYGTSLAYPTRCVGAHISTVPNHITGSTVGFVCFVTALVSFNYVLFK